MRLLLAGVVVVAGLASGAPNPKISEGRRQFEDLEFEKAARTLAAAEATPGNDRLQVLEILELQGVLFGTMNKEAKARDAFRELLTLDPAFTLERSHPPRVRTPFYEAKAWVDSTAPLQVEPGATVDAKVTALTLTVKKDTLRLVKGARFFLLGGADAAGRDVALTGNVATMAVDVPAASWRVHLLGARDAVLAELGPFEHRGSAAPVATTPEPAPPSATTTVEAPGTGWLRPTSYALLGSGAVAVGVGVAFGLISNEARARVVGATANDAGLIETLTQREAAALEARARSQATVANVLFGAGGALLVAGAVLFFVGAPAEPGPQVTLLLSPSSIGVAGVFP